ncbi:hypothetical protein EKO04_009764 [Ascochyta lentis]|uniref:PLC-like phosphodiesterase n=1 Tax=Ascochyta lentis TaxID=205686 RepID=A0A8H7MDU6_9PLEO|nr:hypothetical protein EKO04_009764 [Ascochyta lentis]
MKQVAASFIRLFLALVAVPLVAAQRACNNAPELCSTSYDQTTHLGAHDSPFLRDASTGFSSFGNQFFNSTVQLDAGVRLLSAQVHVASNSVTQARELHLCHTSCGMFDVGLFKDWLWEIRSWMDLNPNEVVTLVLVNMDGIDARELQGEYSKADIAHYGWVPADISKTPPPSSEFKKTWPTLGEMIDNGERLVTFVNPINPDKENAPYLLNEFDFVWENAYDVRDAGQFACKPDRPSNTTTIDQERDSGKLFLMNHMLYWSQAMGIEVPDIRNINETNSWDGTGGLGTHMTLCGGQVTRQPTFVLVDFFNVGPAIKAVDNFNGVDEPVGRKNVTTQVIHGGAGMSYVSSSEKKKGDAWVALVVALVGIVICM